MKIISAGAAAVLFLSQAVGRADVLVVDATGGAGSAHLDIGDALLAASDGDVLLVRAGSYGGFALNGLGVSIVADTGALVVTGGIEILDLGPDQSAALCGLSVLPTVGGEFVRPLTASFNRGAIWAQDCTFRYATSGVSGAVRLLESDAVGFLDCTIDAHAADSGLSSGGIHADDSTVSVQGSSLFGPTGDLPAPDAGAALLVEGGSHAYVVDSDLHGGDGYHAGSVFGERVAEAGDGGPGLRARSGSTVFLRQVELGGGVGGAPEGTCVAGLPGVESMIDGGATVDLLAGDPRKLVMNSPAHAGEVVTTVFEGVVGDLVLLVWSLEQQPTPFLEVLGGALLPDLATSSLLLAGVLPGGGLLQFGSGVPEIAGGSLTLYAQALFVDGAMGFTLSNGRKLLLLGSGL